MLAADAMRPSVIASDRISPQCAQARSSDCFASLAMTPATTLHLPHHARDKPGLAPRRLDLLFQEAMRVPADIARPRIGPGPAFVVGGAGGLAGLVALAALEFEIACSRRRSGRSRFRPRRCAARPRRRRARRRRSNCPGTRAGTLLFSQHTAPLVDVGRIAEAPGPAAPVALAHQRAIGGIARGDRRTLIVAAGTVEIGLRQRRPRGRDGRQTRRASPHTP